MPGSHQNRYRNKKCQGTPKAGPDKLLKQLRLNKLIWQKVLHHHHRCHKQINQKDDAGNHVFQLTANLTGKRRKHD